MRREETYSVKSNEELKQRQALNARDEENTEKEIVTTNSPICSEGSRVVQNQTLLSFQFFHGTPAPT